MGSPLPANATLGGTDMNRTMRTENMTKGLHACGIVAQPSSAKTEGIAVP